MSKGLLRCFVLFLGTKSLYPPRGLRCVVCLRYGTVTNLKD